MHNGQHKKNGNKQNTQKQYKNIRIMKNKKHIIEKTKNAKQ